MLNEGWDVLNLFDIVRLYDTRQSGTKVSPYTIKEAQLIGRGARYCPFQISDDQERFKRKYDYDLKHPNRILETMYFHSKNDSRYIAELRQALISTGMEDEKPIKLNYQLKEHFKESVLYKKGFVFSNKRIPKDRSNVKELEGSKKTLVHTFTKKDTRGSVINLFGDIESANKDTTEKTKVISYAFKDIPYNIMSGTSDAFREFKFAILKEKYPQLKSKKEFFTSDKYFGNNVLEIKYTTGEVTGKDIYDGLLKAFNEISSYIVNLKPEYEGSKVFYPKKISDVIKDKTIYVSSIDANGGKGESQNYNINEKYQLNLVEEPWYAYNDNYGTSEEKLFITYFNREIKPKLEKKNLKFFLVRNERIPELAIYSFENGERFEPDFLLFVEKETTDKDTNFQVYIEPKGDPFLLEDDWKEAFLLQVQDTHKIEKTLLTAHKNYTIIGFPFFNENERTEKFAKAVNEWLDGAYQK